MAKRNDICVIGIGRFGSAIVNQLIELDKSVLILDNDPKSLSKFSSPLVSSVLLDASDTKALQSVGVDEIDVVIVALADNIEIVAALLDLNINHIIARASSNKHARILRQIGVDVIVRPEQESGVRTALIATNSNFIRYSKNLTEIGEGFVIGSSVLLNIKYVNVPLKDLDLGKLGISIVVIKNGEKTFLADGNVKLYLGDTLTVVGKISNVTKFFGLISADKNENTKEETKTRWKIKRFDKKRIMEL